MKKYTYAEVLEASTKYFNGNDLSGKVFVDKYALRDLEDSDLFLELSPVDMHKRIAKEFAKIEKKKFGKNAMSYKEIFDCLDGFKRIVPQGSPMYGIGNPRPISLSNCYVLDAPEDSYGGIHLVDQQLTQISKRRGGVGIDLSKLRPAGAATHNSSRASTGLVSFAARFSNSIREVGQGGRRGALMLTIDVHHPDALAFAQVKKDMTKVTGANLSIRLTDEFLEAVTNDEDYEVRWPVDAKKPKVSEMRNAREMWSQIIECAHGMAEPGLLFWDKIIRESPADCYGEHGFDTICTNPCSELPLCSHDSCRLLLLNLLTYVKNPFTKKAYFDYDWFYADSKIAQRFMDNMIDLELEKVNQIIKKIKSDPEPAHIKQNELDIWHKIKRMCEQGRRTGTGITGLGDAIAALGIKYDSKKGVDTCEHIYQALKFACYESSIDMAEELGTFEVWNADNEKDCPFFKRFYNETCELNDGKAVSGRSLMRRMKKVGRRNIALLTTAPAGSVSMMTQTSSGIEPVFSLYYMRKKKGNPNDQDFRSDEVDQNGDHWMHFVQMHPPYRQWMREQLKKLPEEDITLEEAKSLLKHPWVGSLAPDLNWKKRSGMQGRVQSHVDHAISSTINLPNEVTVEEVADIYETAWKEGCKGITVYRDGCRTGVIVSIDDEKEEVPDKRPKQVKCDVHHITKKGEEYFVLVGIIGDKPYEVFAGKNGFMSKKVKEGKIVRARKGVYRAELDDDTEILPQDLCSNEEEMITRLASSCLQNGTDIHDIVLQLEKSQGDILGFGKSIARALKKYIADGTQIKGEVCSQCSVVDSLIRQEGCATCQNCGFSKCS
jgi:ribonucleoside-diphosphate reductase alpha chain